MKIGDKIRFLSTTGGGIVRGFQGKDIAIVESDGFDIPVLMKECLVIDAANEAQVHSSVKPTTTSRIEQVQEVKHVVVETKEGDKITVCLAYLPIDIKNLNTTGYECYLVNDSNYYLSYNYMSRGDAGWNSRNAGVIEPNTKLFMDEFDKTDLNELEKVCLQFIAYKKDKPFALKNSFSVEVKVDTVKFYKLHSFRDNDYFEDEAIIYYIAKKDLAENNFEISAEDLGRAMMEKETPRRQRIEPIAKKAAQEILEVDLHIDELLDTTAGLSSGDMLEYQLKVFRDTLEENKGKKGKKIVFIHGKGDGVLKNTILKELKTRYKGLYFQDASFREYGFGATMVTM